MRRRRRTRPRVRRLARGLVTAAGAFLALCGGLLTLAAPDVSLADTASTETDGEARVDSDPRPRPDHAAARSLEVDSTWLWQPRPDPRAPRRRARRLTSRARAAFEDAQRALGRNDQGTAAQHLAVGLDQLSELTETLAAPPSPQP